MATDSSGIALVLPAVAVFIITLFAVTLAQAAPVEGVKGHDSTYRVSAANITIKRLPIDSVTDREAALFSTPAPAPSFESYRLRPRIRETN
jgi:hypothetical protein